MPKIIGIIPARKWSKRVAGKNMRMLGGKPLVQLAIESAISPPWFNKIFDTIVVSSDWGKCLDLAKSMGVEALRRPDELCRDESHDAEFVAHALEHYPGHDYFAILRPTSPFRTFLTVTRAFLRFNWAMEYEADSLRAVEKTKGHPKKSWVMAGELMEPYMPWRAAISKIPPFDLGTQQLGEVFCQNACIHIGKTSNIREHGNVSGRKIAPFLTVGYEGVNIDTEDDLEFAEWLIEQGKVKQGGY